MFINRLQFFENLYLEELEMIEESMQTYPNNPEIIEEWKNVAKVINAIHLKMELEVSSC